MTQRYHLFFFSGAIREEKFNLMLIQRMEHFFLSLFCFEKWTVWSVGVRACVNDCPSVKNRFQRKFFIFWGGGARPPNANCSWRNLFAPKFTPQSWSLAIKASFLLYLILTAYFYYQIREVFYWPRIAPSVNAGYIYIYCRIILGIF